ncbi:MAG: hypothetical protein AAF495_18010 [Pseudomonadota bacterium]
MSSADHLGTYAGGWTNGDAAAILDAAADGFVFDDPNAGPIAKADFAAYFAQLKETVESLRGGSPQANFMDLSEVVTNEEGGVLTAWCWWSIPGTEIQGSGLIKASDDGILSERITYYTALAG